MLFLEKQCVLLDLKSATKETVLLELAEAVHDQCPQIGAEELAAVLRERESFGSTGVGNGVAIPHGKITGLEETILCFGRSQRGISYDAVDNHPVQLFVLILSPNNMTNEYLKTLAQVSRLLKQPRNRTILQETSNPNTVVDLFAVPS